MADVLLEVSFYIKTLPLSLSLVFGLRCLLACSVSHTHLSHLYMRLVLQVLRDRVRRPALCQEDGREPEKAKTSPKNQPCQPQRVQQQWRHE